MLKTWPFRQLQIPKKFSKTVKERLHGPVVKFRIRVALSSDAFIVAPTYSAKQWLAKRGNSCLIECKKENM